MNQFYLGLFFGFLSGGLALLAFKYVIRVIDDYKYYSTVKHGNKLVHTKLRALNNALKNK